MELKEKIVNIFLGLICKKLEGSVLLEVSADSATWEFPTKYGTPNLRKLPHGLSSAGQTVHGLEGQVVMAVREIFVGGPLCFEGAKGASYLLLIPQNCLSDAWTSLGMLCT